MDAWKLIKATKAEIAAGRALAWVDGGRVVLARTVDGEMVLTDEGQEVAQAMAARTAKAKAKASAATAEH